MPESVYIHIPFCLKKCNYCAFISYSKPEFEDKYIEALIKEIQTIYSGERIKTLYFGGGTPSLLKIKNIKKIIKNFVFDTASEVTFEYNPDDYNKEYLSELFDIGINRLSLGAQTFDDKILKIIGRRHKPSQVIQTVTEAKKTGFKNISVDLIYGLPEQNRDILKKDLEIINNLDIQHVSTYGLKIEPNTPFYKNIPQNLPDDDEQADFYILIKNTLKKYGFEQYEISNFSLKGYESKHNLNYWNCEEYYGFGVSAHGYVNGCRYSNPIGLGDYINSPLENKSRQKLSDKEKLEEEIFLGFRKSEGIDINKINNKFSIDFDKKYKNVIEKYLGEYITKTEKGYSFTTKGFLLSNVILADFL